MEVGYYRFYKQHLIKNIQDLRTSFSAAQNFQLAYSIKANYYSELLKVCQKEELGFDCASEFELDMLLKQEVDANKIWVNTPFLNQALCRKCIQHGILIYIESLKQLRDIQALQKEEQKPLKIGLRINLENLEKSRFGIRSNSEELKEIIRSLTADTQLKLVALHSHYSGSKRTSDQFARRAESLLSVYKTYFSESDIEILNIGGGMAGPIPEALKQQLDYLPPSWNDYASALSNAFDELKSLNLRLIVEPGMALAANVFDFHAEVIELRKQGEKNIAIINASKTFLKPTNHSKTLSFEVRPRRGGIRQDEEYELMGISCMETDILGKFKGHLQAGDQVLFKNVGAYTLSYSPDFIFAKAAVINTRD